MSKYLGRNQIATCMRSGAKCRAADLVRDGRNPALLVLPEWADPPHPQERPYVPMDVEGKARWPISPENLTFVAPALDAVGAAGRVNLTWTIAQYGPDSPVATYDIYRSVDGGVAYTLLHTVTVVYTSFGALVTPSVYVDLAVLSAHTYFYKLTATSQQGFTLDSNADAATVP